MTDDYCYLCCNCGEITKVDSWAFFQYTETGRRRKNRKNETDPVAECPVCWYEHIDGNYGPGVYDGTQEHCEKERAALLSEKHGSWAADWAEVKADVAAGKIVPSEVRS